MIFVSSWDDGHPDDERLGELLQRYGFKGTFFVPLRNREGLPVITPASLRALARSHEVGSHTLDHVYLRGLPEQRVRQQVCEGRERLQDLLGRSVTGFCYPGGEIDETATRVVREAGFGYARSVENLVTTMPMNRYRLATTLQIFPHSAPVLAYNLLRYPRRLGKTALLAQLMAGRSLTERLRIAASYTRRRSGVLHIWGHSWELERHDLWATLEQFLRWVSDLAPRTMSLTELMNECA
jgi:peptidoglycan/xylan/chitin deacetylase (PgdA/CDA1 family)